MLLKLDDKKENDLIIMDFEVVMKIIVEVLIVL